MKEVTVKVTWKGDCVYIVDDDWECPDYLSEFTEEQLEEMTPVCAEITDWGLTRTRFNVDR